MANITIAGNSFVVTSTITMDDMEKVKKYRPGALTLKDEETKETYFKVGVGTGTASLNDHGISFSGVSNDDKKLANATLPIPSDVEDAKAYVLDRAAVAIANLNKVEEAIVVALKDIKAEHEKIAQNIKVSI